MECSSRPFVENTHSIGDNFCAKHKHRITRESLTGQCRRNRQRDTDSERGYSKTRKRRMKGREDWVRFHLGNVQSYLNTRQNNMAIGGNTHSVHVHALPEHVCESQTAVVARPPHRIQCTVNTARGQILQIRTDEQSPTQDRQRPTYSHNDIHPTTRNGGRDPIRIRLRWSSSREKLQVQRSN
jgi:hypothetical protein